MLLEKMILDYIYEFEGLKASSTTRVELGLYRSLMKCFKDLKIYELDDLKYESYKSIVTYFKMNTRLKNASINKITSFMKTIIRHNRFIQHTFLLTKALKSDVIHVKAYSQEELISIIRFFNSLNASDNSVVYKAVVNLLYATGCRVGELLDIEIKNIDLKNRIILLTKTKTMKPRYVYFNRHHDEFIIDLINSNKQKQYLFWNNLKDRRLSKEDIKNFNKRAKDKLGISINTRRFRKTMATDLAKVTSGDLKMIQTILGHSDIKMTQVYVEYSDEQAKNIYDDKSTTLPLYKK